MRFAASLALGATLAAALSLAACGGGSADVATDSAAAPAAPATPAATTTDARVAAADSGRIRGAAAAPVWLIEVSDYQCPYCRLWHQQTFADIDREYIQTGRVRFAYMHFPVSGHRHAPLASEAALCAGAQGKFWELHDRLFATQQQWSDLPEAAATFDSLARASGLDEAAYGECMTSDVMLPVIEADRDRMRRLGVNSTPTFFVGDQRIEGAQPTQVFRAALDAALAGASGAPAGGAAPAAPSDSARRP